MAEVERGEDWRRLVERTVDEFLQERGLDAEAVWAPAEEPPLRELLTSYSVHLLAAAGTGTSSLRCNDGHSTVDCQFILRPNGSPYYRCMHSPPDCYDASFQKIGCP